MADELFDDESTLAVEHDYDYDYEHEHEHEHEHRDAEHEHEGMPESGVGRKLRSLAS